MSEQLGRGSISITADLSSPVLPQMQQGATDTIATLILGGAMPSDLYWSSVVWLSASSARFTSRR